MFNMNLLFTKGRVLTEKDRLDSYTNLAYLCKLPNYRILTLSSLIGGDKKVEPGKDVPQYCFEFIAEQECCLGIANVVNGYVPYMVLKSLKEKKFLTTGDLRQIPYGVFSFEDFRYGDWLIIVEGLKDRDILSTIYPNVIATQTAGMGSMLKEVVLTLTNRFVLFYDNMKMDESGKKAIYRDKKFLESRNCQVVIGQYPEGVKDIGEIADCMWKGDFFRTEYLRSFFKMQLAGLGLKVK